MTDKISKDPAATPAGSGPSGTPYEAIKAIPVRHYGRWISAVVVVALLGWLVYAFSQGNIIWDTVWDKLFDESVLVGLWKTVLISVSAMALGLVLGIVFAVMRLSKNPVTGAVSWL
ncbi:amino acid ABC transporter permease, partial [Streptomyces sp. NPDC047974]